jgi:hypothetical protein
VRADRLDGVGACRGQASWRATTRWPTPPPPGPSRYVHPPHAALTRLRCQGVPLRSHSASLSRPLGGEQVGLNKFSDWSEDEITQLMGDRVDSAVEAQLRPFDLSSLSGGSPPASVDYRDGNNSFGKPGLTPIKVGRSSRMRPGVCLTVVDTEMRPWRVVDAHDWWSYRIRSRAARAGLSRRWRWWRARFYLRRTRSRTSASSSSTSKSDLYCRIVALPLVVRGFGMQHQVIRCAFLPGFDG